MEKFPPIVKGIEGEGERVIFKKTYAASLNLLYCS
jgi:hypothetical protein